MSDPTYFEDNKAVTQEHPRVVISREGLGTPFSPAVNDNKLPRGLLMKRFIISGCIMVSMIVLLYFLTM